MFGVFFTVVVIVFIVFLGVNRFGGFVVGGVFRVYIEVIKIKFTLILLVSLLVFV